MVAGNQVDMQVHYGLSGGLSIVYSDIEPIGVAFNFQDAPHFEDNLEEGSLFLSTGLETPEICKKSPTQSHIRGRCAGDQSHKMSTSFVESIDFPASPFR